MVVDIYHYSSFQEVARRYELPVSVVIQDYAALAVLAVLADMGVLEGLAFKGGTAIKRVHFPEARFSIDLDFQTLSPRPLEEVAKRYYRRIKRLEGKQIGSLFITGVDEPLVTDKWVMINILYRSPGFDYMTRVDIENPRRYVEPVLRPIQPEPFFLTETVRVLSVPIEDILMEKLIALADRTDPKDLWDVFFLAKIKGVRVSGIGKEVGMPLDKYLMAIDLITKRDWERLSVQYLPFYFRKHKFEEVVGFVKSFVEANWNS